MTNLRRTCNVFAISKVICGKIHKDEFKLILQNNTDFKNRIMSRINNYKDSFFKFLVAMLRNIPSLRALPIHLLKNIIYKLKERKYTQGSTILALSEYSDKCFFVLRG